MDKNTAWHAKIRPVNRWLIAATLFISVPAGLTPFFDEKAMGPLFDLAERFMELRWWGALWLVSAFCAMVALISGRWVPYAISFSLGFSMSVGWTVSVSWSKFFDGVPVTITAVGLWAYASTAMYLGMIAPQLVRLTNDHEMEELLNGDGQP